MRLSFCKITFLHFIEGDEECPMIIKRNQWSTTQAKSVNYLILPIPYVVIHHTATADCSTKVQCINSIENIRSYHMETLGWHDIGYS